MKPLILNELDGEKTIFLYLLGGGKSLNFKELRRRNMAIKHYFCPPRALAGAGAHNTRMPQHAVRTKIMKGCCLQGR